MQIAFVYNSKNKYSFNLILQLADYLRNRHVEIKEFDGNPGVLAPEVMDYGYEGCDTVIVLGGDGTMLEVARFMARLDIPLFGINMGTVGFLSSVERDEAFEAMDRLLCGDYTIQKRLMLAAELKRSGESIAKCTGLNEIVVSSGINSRAITLDLFIDRAPINSYNADGIIVASPTGSTGYSLSAGGPLVMEELNVLLVTPICSHSFFSRPIVAADTSVVTIVNRSTATSASLVADGQFRFSLKHNDTITIARSRFTAKMIRFDDGTYFERIKNKLYV